VRAGRQGISITVAIVVAVVAALIGSWLFRESARVAAREDCDLIRQAGRVDRNIAIGGRDREGLEAALDATAKECAAGRTTDMQIVLGGDRYFPWGACMCAFVVSPCDNALVGSGPAHFCVNLAGE
jgi:hypothetical protein